MKLRPVFYASLLLISPVFLQAGTVTLVTGTPGDGVISPAASFSPNLHGLLLNFSDLSTNASCQGGTVTSCPAFNPATYASQGVAISSTDGLVVYPYSVQSGPNELFDNSTDGSANITISLSSGTTAIGVGIADSDDLSVVGGGSLPVTITLQALGLGGVDLGSPFTVTTPELDPNTAGNGYWAVEDSSADIFGLQISAPTTDEGGLSIADVQVATPEPSSFLLLFAGVATMVGSYRLRKKI